MNDLDTLNVSMRHITAAELEKTPRYSLEEHSAGVDSLLISGGPMRDGIWNLVATGPGAAALVTDQGQSVIHVSVSRDSGISETASTHFEGSIAYLARGGAGGVLVTPERSLHLHVARNGSVVDTVRARGHAVVGRFADGSLLIRDAPKNGRVRTGEYAERQVLDFLRVRPDGTGGETIMLRGAITYHNRFGPTLPWSPVTLVALLRDKVWVTGRSGPDIVRFSRNGKPELRVTWETQLAKMTRLEIDAWYDSRIRHLESLRTVDSLEFRRRRDMLLSLVNGGMDTSAPALDRLVAGYAGRLWIRERLRQDSLRAVARRRWIAVDMDGNPVMILSHSARIEILDFDEDVLWARSNEDQRLLLAFRFSPPTPVR